ncbi:hypothetical protein [Streptomyces sp. SYSU K21746]
MTTQTQAAAAGDTPGRPARDPDPTRNAAYWARIDAAVATAPPLTDDQRARLRAIFHQPAAREAA